MDSLVALLGGAAAGAIWAFPAGWLRGRRGVHEVITTLMLSYIALHLTTFMRRYPLFDPKSTSQSSITVPSDARLPGLDALFTGSRNLGRLNIGVLIAIAASIASWFFLYRTTWGFEIRAVGSNAAASAAAGIDGGKTMILALCVGGALAGLGGAVQLLGLYHRISTNSFVGLGFAGFFIALVARNNPLAVIPAALFFGALSAGGLKHAVQRERANQRGSARARSHHSFLGHPSDQRCLLLAATKAERLTMQQKKKVLLVGETWVSAATHYKGFDNFSSATFHSGASP